MFWVDGLAPADLLSAYGASAATPPSTQTIALVDAYDDATIAGDLEVFSKQFGLSACSESSGCLRKVNQNGKAGPLPASSGEKERGWAQEIATDYAVIYKNATVEQLTGLPWVATFGASYSCAKCVRGGNGTCHLLARGHVRQPLDLLRVDRGILGPKQAPGKYAIRLTVNDKIGNTAKAFLYTFEVVPQTNMHLGGHPKPAINRHLKTGH